MSGQVRWSTITGGLVRVSDDDPDVLVPVAAPAIDPFLAAPETDENPAVRESKPRSLATQ